MYQAKKVDWYYALFFVDEHGTWLALGSVTLLDVSIEQFLKVLNSSSVPLFPEVSSPLLGEDILILDGEA